ncbi:MAG: Mut7-C RNAse domain-containing protein [Syntrophales bacterium]|nr:Mut7-C RNAse domain-containing protein [Syntrophales bacterium]MDD5531594.1 Mut7-C RNAse domain-containing protein [Syntrophales bacterium]
MTDRTLGRLARWLRLLGHDTAMYEGKEKSGRDFLNAALRERRIALSRNRSLAKRQYRGELKIVRSDRIEEQLREMAEEFGLGPSAEGMFQICMVCNEKLLPADRREVKGLIPDYVEETQASFRKCPCCGRIFWPGTHLQRAEAFMKRHIPKDRP